MNGRNKWHKDGRAPLTWRVKKCEQTWTSAHHDRVYVRSGCVATKVRNHAAAPN